VGASIMAAECLTAVIKILFKNLDRTGRELSCLPNTNRIMSNTNKDNKRKLGFYGFSGS